MHPLDVSVAGQNVAVATSATGLILTGLAAEATNLTIYNPGPNTVHVRASANNAGSPTTNATTASVPLLPGTLNPVRKSQHHAALSLIAVGGAQNVVVFSS